MRIATMAPVFVVVLAGLSQAAAETPDGLWVRPNKEVAEVSQQDGKLYCKIVTGKSPGFEMCHGMAKAGENTWQGGEMKHPEMPAAMTFNGTVTLEGPALNIKGCVIAQHMCAEEKWTRQQ